MARNPADLGAVVCAAPWVAPGDGADKWSDMVREAVEAYCSHPRPLFSRIPVPYHLVPIAIRVRALAFLSKTRTESPNAFPAWPIHNPIDACVPAPAGQLTYGGRRAALLLTHDIDSRPELDLIGDLVDLERGIGVRSSFGFVPERSWPSDALAASLLDAGSEIYLHDIAHDGRLPYRGRDAIRRLIEAALASASWASEHIRSFRAGQLMMSRDLMSVLQERFSIDLSLPDTERGGPYGASAGCGTVLPFRIGTLLEFPLSLPQDVYLDQVHGFTAGQTLAVWLKKLEHILSAGGVATLNTHPIWVNKHRPAMWRTYESLLAHVAHQPDWLITTPTELSEVIGSGRA